MGVPWCSHYQFPLNMIQQGRAGDSLSKYPLKMIGWHLLKGCSHTDAEHLFFILYLQLCTHSLSDSHLIHFPDAEVVATCHTGARHYGQNGNRWCSGILCDGQHVLKPANCQLAHLPPVSS